jgi:hypothetical protein
LWAIHDGNLIAKSNNSARIPRNGISMTSDMPSPSVPETTLRDLEDLVSIAKASLGAPHEILTHDERGPYLEKWHLSRESDGSARLLHVILRSDGDDELHDHPWDNRTLMVSGGYWDVTPKGRRWISPGDIVMRKANDFHRIELQPGIQPMTIFWHGPKINEWGFLGLDGIKIPADEFLARSASYRLSNR